MPALLTYVEDPCPVYMWVSLRLLADLLTTQCWVVRRILKLSLYGIPNSNMKVVQENKPRFDNSFWVRIDVFSYLLHYMDIEIYVFSKKYVYIMYVIEIST